jgi:hypothetical protein
MTTSTPTTTRTVRVTAGDRDYVWFTATESTGKDISADTVSVGFGTWYEPPSAPITPNGASDQTQHPATSSVRVGLLIAASTGSDGAHVVLPGKYEGWIKISDSPTVAWVRCGPVEVI